MKAKVLLLSVIAVILLSSAGLVPSSKDLKAYAAESEIEPTTRNYVLEATVRITLITSDRNNQNQDKVARDGHLGSVSEGLGTVVQDGDKIYIVTHDHWSYLANSLRKVELRNAQGELLDELERGEFYGLIRYRDGGTMVLEAPDSVADQLLAVQAIWNAGQEAVQAGDEMVMAYWNPGEGDQVDVERVSVKLVEEHGGLPSLMLKNLSGKAVVSGNSGGGVFKDGKLVANMWSTVMVRVEDEGGSGDSQMTDLSRAAQVAFEEEQASDLPGGSARLGGNEI